MSEKILPRQEAAPAQPTEADAQALLAKLAQFMAGLPPAEATILRDILATAAASKPAKPEASVALDAEGRPFPALEMASGPTLGQVLIFRTTEVTLGRHADNDLELSDRKVSGHHASILKEAGGTYVLLDRGSANGTSLNGSRISEPAALREGDLIQIGDTALIFSERPPRT